MFTLRIFFTGMMAFGPVQGPGTYTQDVWALMAKVEDPKHYTELRLGCRTDGEACEHEIELSDEDLMLWIDDKAIIKSEGFRIDYSFREHVVDIAELTGPTPRGHFNCTTAPSAKPLAKVPSLETLEGLQKPASKDNPPANLVRSRFYLTAGGVFDAKEKKCSDDSPLSYCNGKLAATDIPGCDVWKFPPKAGSPGARCTRMANTVVYELLVATNKVKLRRARHRDGTVTDIPEFALPSPIPPVVEVWVINAPRVEQTAFDHFEHVWALFKSGQIVQRRVPMKPDRPGTCKDLPGLQPIKCPVMQF